MSIAREIEREQSREFAPALLTLARRDPERLERLRKAIDKALDNAAQERRQRAADQAGRDLLCDASTITKDVLRPIGRRR